ncbi:MAG: cobyric acid synthase CobQ [Candidatus Kapaibacterium sp.]
MANHTLKFYPVGNGDMTLIRLTDGTSILIDCNIREAEETSDGDAIFDVKEDLNGSIPKTDGVRHMDVFMLTHPDEDHCFGFKNSFYTGDPKKYSEDDKKTGLIIIDELWVTSMLFDCASSDDAKALKKEAQRRLDLYAKGSDVGAGNRLRMIGYNGDEMYEDVPNTIPGTIINLINGDEKKNFEFFVHAPFKKSLVQGTAEPDKNYSSVVMQARFRNENNDAKSEDYYLFGGDADHYLWKEILEQSETHENEDKLVWDYFLAPHHCSWTFFNDTADGCDEPMESSLAVLKFGRTGAKIIASCKCIEDDDNNPPHHDAKILYIKKGVSSEDDFIELASPADGGDAKPIEFEIPRKIEDSNSRISNAKLIPKSIVALANEAQKPWSRNDF